MKTAWSCGGGENDQFEDKELPNILNVRCEKQKKKRVMRDLKGFGLSRVRELPFTKTQETVGGANIRGRMGNSVLDILRSRCQLDMQAERMRRQLWK